MIWGESHRIQHASLHGLFLWRSGTASSLQFLDHSFTSVNGESKGLAAVVPGKMDCCSSQTMPLLAPTGDE